MRAAARRVYRVHGVEIDLDSGRIRRGAGGDTYLRSKAHKLLVCLIEHRHAPVSKEDLVRMVWGGEAVSDDSLVNCVQSVRRALSDDARSPAFIRTIPKTGYWFVAPIEEEPLPAQSAEVEAELAPVPKAAPELTPGPVQPVHFRWRLWAVLAGVVAIAGLVAWRMWRVPAATPTYWEAAWWSLDGAGSTVRDRVSGRTVPLPAGVTRTAGLSGPALHFDGSDVVVAGSGSDALRDAPPGRTIVTWVRTASNSADTATVFHEGSSNPTDPVLSYLTGIHQTGRAGLFSSAYSVLGATRLDDNRWHQLAGVFDVPAGRARVFVDGVEEANQSIPLGDWKPNPVSRWAIGRAIWGGTPFRGDIDGVRIFTRALRPTEIRALYRCGTGVADLELQGRGPYYFSPVHGDHVAVEPRPDGEASVRIRNTGRDYAGAILLRRDPECALKSTLAADLGQDLQIEADIRVGGNSTDRMAEAGPFFRSRSAAPGDGIVGGTSAGYWVQLKSTGQVRIRRLNPSSTVAFSVIQPKFDPDAFHRLSVIAKGDQVTVSLDGQTLEFDQAGTRRTQALIPPAWESASPKGKNQGGAGFAFSCEGNRSAVGGQEVRNIRVSLHHRPDQ